VATVKQPFNAPGAPTPPFPFSAALRANGFVFVSGQVSEDLVSGQPIPGDVRAQTRQVLENVRTLLRAAGSDIDRLVKTTVFLADVREFDAMSEVYRAMIPPPFPTRSAVEAKLSDPWVLVEIEAVALAGDASEEG
jgi:2-iminobutanoate/2-iminopropanoate deaminase